ncbi:hypothetical protein ACIHEI_28775 [Kitasatospora sp. NPDC051984]|uniref:hypothetical protein n=1 Tax=Kitasatospora sp. NPDC051984 TaxID=3364059 RepID=UPI0037CBAAE5
MEAVDTVEQSDRVPRSGRILAALAVLCAAPAVFWIVVYVPGAPFDGMVGLGAAATTAPLFTRDAAAFRTSCLITGWALFAVSVLGFLFALFVLMPASFVLLIAASQARPRPPRLPMTYGIVVSAATLGFAGWALGTPFFLEPDVLLATVQEGSPLLKRGHSTPVPSDFGHGAVSVYLTETGGAPGGTLHVRFAPRTPAADLAELRRAVAGLPGVSNLRICNQQDPTCH